MTKKWAGYIIAGVVLGLLAAVAWGLWRPKVTTAPTVNNSSTTSNTNSTTTNTTPATTNTTPTSVNDFSTSDLPDRDSHFAFTADLPSGLVAEYVSSSQAINFYDPKASGTSLEQSKIFVKYFTASDFETLTTVDIKSRVEATINDRPAVTYVIVKKSGVPDFANQPSWRNDEHRVTDIRTTNASPTTFYVFAKSPAVSDPVFDQFLNSLTFGPTE